MTTAVQTKEVSIPVTQEVITKPVVVSERNEEMPSRVANELNQLYGEKYTAETITPKTAQTHVSKSEALTAVGAHIIGSEEKPAFLVSHEVKRDFKGRLRDTVDLLRFWVGKIRGGHSNARGVLNEEADYIRGQKLEQINQAVPEQKHDPGQSVEV